MEMLKKKYEFTRVYKRGRHTGGKYLTINVLKNPYDKLRVGISISKKVFKSAVKRNLYRRRIKEILRTGRFELSQGYDVVFVPKKSVTIPTSQELKVEIIDLLEKAEVITKNEKITN